jgi:hypothetical protein
MRVFRVRMPRIVAKAWVLLACAVACASASGPGASGVKSSAAAAADMGPADVAGVIDRELKFFHDDMYVQAKAGPQLQFPPSPPGSSSPPTFAAYGKWLSELGASLVQSTDPWAEPQFQADARAASAEIAAYAGVHYQCLNVPTCRDVDLQRAELQGLDLSAVGSRLATLFKSQSPATKAAGAAYLRQAYSLP